MLNMWTAMFLSDVVTRLFRVGVRFNGGCDDICFGLKNVASGSKNIIEFF